MIKKRLLAASLALAAVAIAPPTEQLSPISSAEAAVTNIAVGAGQVMVLPFHISGQYTATTASVVKFNMPQPCDMLGVGTTARASGGTSPTLTVDVKSGGTTILSAPISVTAGTYSEGTLTTTAIPDENAITVDLAITGTSPTWNDITLILTCARK